MIRIRIPAGVWVALGWILARSASGDLLDFEPVTSALHKLGWILY